MANRRISELQEQAGLQLDEDDLLTVVHVAEADPAIRNKKLTISGDTRPCENIMKYGLLSDVLLHEVFIEGEIKKFTA